MTVPEPDRPMQKWLDFAGDKRGLAFLNDGKYGYDASLNQVRISLMRAPTHRDGKLVGLGPFSFSYAVMPHRGDWKSAGLPQRGYEFNNDLVPVFADPHEGLPLAGRSFCRIQDPRVLVTAVKRAEDGQGIVMRLHESQGTRAMTSLVMMDKITSACECNLLEAPLPDGDRGAKISDDELEVWLEPFEIKTLRLTVGPFCA
jgi:alpha-mannosidase